MNDHDATSKKFVMDTVAQAVLDSGNVILSDDINSTSYTTFASSLTVKTVRDEADARYNALKSGYDSLKADFDNLLFRLMVLETATSESASVSPSPSPSATVSPSPSRWITQEYLDYLVPPITGYGSWGDGFNSVALVEYVETISSISEQSFEVVPYPHSLSPVPVEAAYLGAAYVCSDPRPNVFCAS